MTVRKRLKFGLLIAMLASVAGIVFLCGFSRPLPAGTRIDGVDVGGMGRRQAIAAVRENTVNELKKKKLEIRAENCVYTYSYPELNYRDELFRLVPSISRAGEYDSGVSYYLCGKDLIVSGICAGESVPVREPSAEFRTDGTPFVYDRGCDGKRVDAISLTRGIEKALEGDFEPVTLSYREVKRSRSLKEIRAETVLLSQYTTYFDEANVNRCNNIRLAAESLNGSVLAGGAFFSFNRAVGERTKERGYLPAKIIENGEYVVGYGGGVCQVSTTLYNAALLSGLKVSEFHPHSLAVGYVPPSRDAMVSGTALDLKFKNPAKTPVYIRAKATGNRLTVSIYGKSGGERYSIESVIAGGIVAPEEYTDDPSKVRDGKDGILSESYLIVSANGVSRRVRLRADRYLPQKRIILKENAPSAVPYGFENNF